MDEIERVTQEAKEKIDELEADFDQRMKTLQEKAHTIHGENSRRQAEKQKEQTSSQEAGRGLAIGLSVAYTLMGLPLVGFGIGYLIDQQQKSPNKWQVWLGLGFTFIGFFMTIYQLNRANK